MKTPLIFLLLLLAAGSLAAEDTLEFLNGTLLKGKVIQILKTEREVEFEATVGGQLQTRRFPYAAIHAVTWNGKQYVVSPKKPGSSSPASAGPLQRSEMEVKNYINQEGATPPDWFRSAKLNYPKSLDLSWPAKPPGGWDNQKNVGQFVWDIINPNPDRWEEGVKLMHHLLETGPKDPVFQNRVMNSLGGMYFRFFGDYARAAFWWQKAGVDEDDVAYVWLGECYWQLGNVQMAEKQLDSRMLRPESIKLWGDLGKTDKAVDLADQFIRAGGEGREANLQAGNALRQAGRYDEALKRFQAVLDDTQPVRNAETKKRYEDRARDSIQAIAVFEQFDLSKIKDGAYTASSVGYSGPIEVRVEIKGGKIDEVKITKHSEKQFYSALTDVPAGIIQKQSVRGVEATSHATITSDAIINAAAVALSGQ